LIVRPSAQPQLDLGVGDHREHAHTHSHTPAGAPTHVWNTQTQHPDHPHTDTTLSSSTTMQDTQISVPVHKFQRSNGIRWLTGLSKSPFGDRK
jgi:hypothetical protein